MHHAIFLDLVFYQPEPCNNNQEVKNKRTIYNHCTEFPKKNKNKYNHCEIENDKLRSLYLNAKDFVLR